MMDRSTNVLINSYFPVELSPPRVVSEADSSRAILFPIHMFKPEKEQERESAQEQHGLPQRQVDSFYEELFHLTWKQPGSVERNNGIARQVLAGLVEELGYRFYEATEPFTDMPMRSRAVEILFESRDTRADDVQMGMIFKDVTFVVDGEAGVITCAIEPHGVSPEQAAPEEAQKALDRMPRAIALRASAEAVARMKEFKDDQLSHDRERVEGMRKFREYAATRIGQHLTPADFQLHWDFLRYVPITTNPRTGFWTIEKGKEDRWRISFWDENKQTGTTSLIDVQEFEDKD